ncbi:hypothetical protein CDO73_05600 [Saccharibacillus sp. O23]|uniref:hypothetical protein n=1 Tax=Saccharibacillus sp. O23 TaxID=2009338 RepID=UPI000B4E7E2A|nr:hypothetical protein [Saccharibacillus sp. O23]OWR31949.1 hypothetical protein CDO73_05600 [Saccharibacillus sp. O23]
MSLTFGFSSMVSAHEFLHPDSLTAFMQNDQYLSIGIAAYAVGKGGVEWEFLKNTEADPTNKSFSVPGGYPNIKMSVKNTGSQPFRVVVQHAARPSVILFDVTVPANGLETPFIDNDYNPKVPIGNYLITLYGGTAAPKGTLDINNSCILWPSD